jgi:hypothetical protein
MTVIFVKNNGATDHTMCNFCIYNPINISNNKKIMCVSGETGCDARHRCKTCVVNERGGRIVRHRRISIC